MNVIDSIAEHLSALGLRFRQPDEDVILISYIGENTPYEAVIQPRGPTVSVIAHTVSLVPAPRLEETIRVVNLLNATRINFGCFWVDPSRRRVAFELTIAAPDGPTQDQVSLAMAALSQIDDHFPMLAAVIWGGRTAESALSTPGPDVEKGDNDEPPLEMAV